MHPRLFAALGVIGLLALVSCGEDADDVPAASDPAATSGAPTTTPGTGSTAPETSAPSSAPPTTAAPDVGAALAGRTFLSTAVDGFTLVEGTQISLTFDGSNVAAVAGCNNLASTWSVEGDVLVVGPMAMTEMACDPPALMDQDTWLSSVLTSRPTVAIDGPTLTLSATGATVTFTDREVADPDRPLEGTTWQVESFISADAVSSLALARIPTLRLEGGSAQVDTGCNRGSGTYELGDGELTFGPLATTRAACVDDLASQAEQQVLATLTGTVTFEIEADVLTLRAGDVGLVLRAAPGAEALQGVTWTYDGTFEPGIDEPVITPAPTLDRPATLVFDGSSVAVDTSCNVGGGSYEATGEEITFGPLTSTLIACTGPSAEVESLLLGGLTGTVTYTFDGDVLVIGLGDIGLRFRPT